MNPFKRILCAVDLSDNLPDAAEYAAMLARSLGAEVEILYVAPTLSQYVGFHVPPSSIENFVGEIVEGAERGMTAFVAEHFEGVKASGKVVTGYAAEEILHYAAAINADLIVIGTHGRKGLDRLLFGSVAQKVAKTAVQPVLTIKPKAEGNV